MRYYCSKILYMSFDDAVARVTTELRNLAEQVQGMLKKMIEAL